MSQIPSVAVVILNWNGRRFLEMFLPSVMASTYKNLKVIVADNASSDDSIAFMEQNYPSIIIIRHEENFGFAKGYNRTLKQVEADYYILLNNDVEVASDWIEPIIELMENDKQVAACQPKILSYNDRAFFEYAGASGGWMDSYGYPFCRGRVFDICEKDIGQYNNAAQVFWASGAALFVRSSAFHELKGFDEYFFAHQEELDLCWRLQHAGHKIFAQPASVVYHVGGGSLPMGDKKKVYLNFRNNLIMLYKNLYPGEKLWKLFYRMNLDGIAALKNLLKGNMSGFIAITKAHCSFYSWLFFHRKESLFPLKYNRNLHGRYQKLVVWQYFINGKTTFSKLFKTKRDI